MSVFFNECLLFASNVSVPGGSGGTGKDFKPGSLSFQHIKKS